MGSSYCYPTNMIELVEELDSWSAVGTWCRYIEFKERVTKSDGWHC